MCATLTTTYGFPPARLLVTRAVLGFGESPGYACPKGSSPNTRTAVIATSSMRSVLLRRGVLVTVQAGITQTELREYATSQRLTLPLGSLLGYSDLTVGGVLSVNGHAQGPKGSSCLVSWGWGSQVTWSWDGPERSGSVASHCVPSSADMGEMTC